MELTVLVFLSSGLFLGWSLGANDAANVFGTAVGTRMVRFGTAALVCSVFVILGAVISGAGAAHTLGTLGSVNALAGSFMAALAAGATVYYMTKSGLPVSTGQAIAGAMIGWNWFSGSVTDTDALVKIIATWIACPILAGISAVVLMKLTKTAWHAMKLRLLPLDAYTRFALIFAGAFGAYSLGANNIANVMGVFVPTAPFGELDVFGLFTLNAAQQLFLIGGIAISVGVFSYSKRVMLTVGNDLFRLSPIAALVVVLAQALVAAEDALTILLWAATPEQVDLDGLEVAQPQDSRKRGLHPARLRCARARRAGRPGITLPDARRHLVGSTSRPCSARRDRPCRRWSRRQSSSTAHPSSPLCYLPRSGFRSTPAARRLASDPRPFRGYWARPG